MTNGTVLKIVPYYNSLKLSQMSSSSFESGIRHKELAVFHRILSKSRRIVVRLGIYMADSAGTSTSVLTPLCGRSDRVRTAKTRFGTTNVLTRCPNRLGRHTPAGGKVGHRRQAIWRPVHRSSFRGFRLKCAGPTHR